ncbi:hypothetical protein [Sphaerochaeta globosa]|jgi:hypothetical protein|uniref:Uncharacterized protein n=1 Tax=Sphaerochaeta globosa (strain ATCC BAA-1886 / DSM 22777 / Buddy) TaxID=158189 RepID=F0RZE4_SPHGB|nr:hypothetical protein [Sphaerochaeta globosa]ADY13496.1 hypothetical protein SpiBuddy_1671 [Sphaerochaeta globosa str. Buddy]
MKEEHDETGGVDIVDDRYVLCIVDNQGMHPRYYRGRADTPLGQANFFGKVGQAPLLMPSGDLAALALLRLGEEQVVIKDESEHFAVWAAAGVKRGQQMARFAALQLFAKHHPSDSLSEKDTQHLFLLQDAELTALLSVVETSQTLAEAVLGGVGDATTYSKALRNEEKSRQDPVIGKTIPNQREASLFSEDDTSFLAKLDRELKKLQ